MKLLKNIMLLVAVAIFASCDSDIETPQLSNEADFIAPVMGQCGNVIVNADNSKDESVIFTWKAADFGQPVQVLYSVYLTDGTTEAFVANSNTTSVSVSKGDLNGVVINGLGVAANSTASVKAFVKAAVDGGEGIKSIQSNITDAFSVTTYAAPIKWLYGVGFFNNWKQDLAVEIFETGGGTNVYNSMINFTNDVSANDGFSGFKILTERSWAGEGNWGYDAFTVGSNITSSSDGNLLLPAGYWQISVNRTAMSIDATKVTYVDILGSFNEWNDTPAQTPLTYDAVENVWVSEPVVFGADGDFLIRLNANWNNKYGSSGIASTAISGGVELVTGGGDNIKVPSEGTYVIKLHANRTPYVVEMIKQ